MARLSRHLAAVLLAVSLMPSIAACGAADEGETTAGGGSGATSADGTGGDGGGDRGGTGGTGAGDETGESERTDGSGSGAGGGPGSGPRGEPVHKYVALGDSYASLASINLGFRGATHEQFCQRSPDNYPAALVAELEIAEFVDASCQGAKIPEMTGPRHEVPNDPSSATVPPQFDALAADTDLVTISIGGNDIGFAPISFCLGGAMLAGGSESSTCATRLEQRLRPDFEALPAQLDAVYAEIRRRAPEATIVATGYMPLLAAPDIAPGVDVAESCPAIEPLSVADRRWAVDAIAELNGIIEAAAHRNGVVYALPSDVVKHSGCARPDRRWVDFDGTATRAQPMHPTAAGQRAMAEAIAAAVR